MNDDSRTEREYLQFMEELSSSLQFFKLLNFYLSIVSSIVISEFLRSKYLDRKRNETLSVYGWSLAARGLYRACRFAGAREKRKSACVLWQGIK